MEGLLDFWGGGYVLTQGGALRWRVYPLRGIYVGELSDVLSLKGKQIPAQGTALREKDGHLHHLC